MLWPHPLRIALLAVALGSVAVLGGCGKSEEDKAQDKVCDARADIEKQVDDLAGLDITSASIDQVQDNLKGIRDDLQTIANEQGDLEPDRRKEVEQAGQKFQSQVEDTAKDVVSGTVNGKEAGASIGSALDQLAKSFREAYAPLDCD